MYKESTTIICQQEIAPLVYRYFLILTVFYQWVKKELFKTIT